MALPAQIQSKQVAGAKRRLEGEQVVFVGKLAGMTRPEACELVVAHGAVVSNDEKSSATLVVIGDNQPDLVSALQADKQTHRRLAEDVAAGRTLLLRESELWERLGLVGEDAVDDLSVQRLYTPAMLAELLGVPVAAIRRWHRRKALVACRSVRRLPYFDFPEVAVARHLSALYGAGCSLAVIDRKLAELHRSMPTVARPLCDPSIVVSGRQLRLRLGDDLAEPGGQLLIDFDKPSEDEEQGELFLSVADGIRPLGLPDAEGGEILSVVDQLQLEALEWEDQGELERAAETYRTLLVATGPAAEIHFALADLLYRMGDLSAARERFYAAIELDEEYVEARANLGCVLAENDELELAVAAFQGALAFHSDYADVHYHLASALDRLHRLPEAELHWRTFLALAPESPWAEAARVRLGQSDEEPLALS